MRASLEVIEQAAYAQGLSGAAETPWKAALMGGFVAFVFLSFSAFFENVPVGLVVLGGVPILDSVVSLLCTGLFEPAAVRKDQRSHRD